MLRLKNLSGFLGHPGFHLGPGRAVGNVLAGRARHVFCEVSHPFVFGSARVLVWGQISFVVEPAKPFSGNLASIVVQVDLVIVLHPSVPSIEVASVLIVFVSVFILSHQFAIFQFILSVQFIQGTFYSTILAERIEEISKFIER